MAEHPQIEGKSAVFSYIDTKDLSQVGFYTTHDTRPAFFEELEHDHAEGGRGRDRRRRRSSTSPVSAENADEFADVDIFVTYGDAEGKTLKTIQADPLMSKIPAIARGSVVILVDSTPLAAARPTRRRCPSTGALDDYVKLLADAADKAA